MRRILATAGIAAGILFAAPGSAVAHPLGNFTVNTYAGLTATKDALRIDYVVDMAEIPAFEARQDMDADGDGAVSAAEGERYASTTCTALSGSLSLLVDDTSVRPEAGAHGVSFPPGAGGIATLRLECEYHAATSPTATIAFENGTFSGRLGWHEVTARGDGVSVAADVPAESVSRRLTAYPSDVLRSAPDVRRAEVRVTSSAAAPSTQQAEPVAPSRDSSPRIDRLSRALVGFAARQHVTAGFLILAALATIALGSLHAAAPGHGKTIIAAAIVGSGTHVRNAIVLGATVAAAHTAAVAGLGVAVATFGVATPERVYPWLTLAGGLAAVAVGVGMVRRWLHARRHTHAHDHDSRGQRRTLVWLGLTGGIVPSPSALLVLLASIGLGRTWLGVVLVTLYGLGMAVTLTATALLVARAGRTIHGRAGIIGRLATATRPAGAFGVCLAGVLLLARGVLSI